LFSSQNSMHFRMSCFWFIKYSLLHTCYNLSAQISCQKVKRTKTKGKPEMKAISNRNFNLIFVGFPVGNAIYVSVSKNSRFYICFRQRKKKTWIFMILLSLSSIADFCCLSRNNFPSLVEPGIWLWCSQKLANVLYLFLRYWSNFIQLNMRIY
jgi:hypothetical protein